MMAAIQILDAEIRSNGLNKAIVLVQLHARGPNLSKL